MNTPVSFEIAKLLKEKGFDKSLDVIFNTVYDIEDMSLMKNVHQETLIKGKGLFLHAPTIAEVVMWLYEKHGIWTVVNVNIMGSWYFEHFDLKEKRNTQFKPTDTYYDSPTEAYSEAIEYTLKLYQGNGLS